MSTVYLNGRLVAHSEAQLPAEDRGVLFGDGAFETLRSYGGRVLRFPEHLARLRQTLAAIDITLPTPDADLIRGTEDLLAAESLSEARIRITVTGGLHEGEIRLARANPPNVLITGVPLHLPPASAYRDGVALVLSPYPVHDASPLARIKTTDRLIHLMAKEFALGQGAYDALSLDEAGHVLETTAANMFFASAGAVYTASLACPVLAGVTRDLVFEAAASIGVSVHEGRYRVETLENADEAFLTGTTVELLPVKSLGGVTVGAGRSGPIRDRLHRAYRDIVGRELSVELPAPDESDS